MRIEFFGLPAHGHINPSLPLVAELVRRGHQLRYWAYPEFQAKIEAEGASFCDLSQYLQLNNTVVDTNLFCLADQLLAGSEVLLDQLLPQLRADPPDLIIYDSLACWGRHLAQALGLPSVCSVTTFALNRSVLGSSGQQTIGLLAMLPAALPNLMAFLRRSAALARRHAIPRPQLAEMFSNPAALNLVYTSRAFQPQAETFSAAYCFVGASVRLPDPAAPLIFEPAGAALRTDLPLVYISLGTLNNRNLDFYRTCFAALGHRPLQVVLSLGHQIKPSDLGAVPANFIVRPSVPQLEVLRRASAFITHAGMNSVHEALVLGVPMLAVPQASDQHWVAERVASSGAGLCLARQHLSAATLGQALDQLLSTPAFRQQSQRLGQSLLAQGGWRHAADAVEGFGKRSLKA
jgi:MGT family glycosyltransferase